MTRSQNNNRYRQHIYLITDAMIFAEFLSKNIADSSLLIFNCSSVLLLSTSVGPFILKSFHSYII